VVTVDGVRIPTRTHLGIRGLVAVLLVASMACAGSPTSDGSPIPEVSAASDVLLDAACPGEEVPTDLSVTCHRLELGDASLSVVVIRSADPTGGPVLHLHGGPGGRAVLDRHRWLAPRSEVLEGHDVILVDQRGGGDSTPSLDCSELDAGPSAGLDDYRSCRRRLDDSGIDRGQTTVHQVALDMVSLREALGLESWHLHGVSFGTRIALELIRIDEGAVLSAVLDSPMPPEVAAYDDLPAGVLGALESLEVGCREVAACTEPGDQVVGQAADATQQRPGAHAADRSNARATSRDRIRGRCRAAGTRSGGG
jgi:pimeloyl-ACP methyl ester carboxylesterase